MNPPVQVVLFFAVFAVASAQTHSGEVSSSHANGYYRGEHPGSAGARYAKYQRRSKNPAYQAYKIPVKLNYTLTPIVTGDTPPGTLVGNHYALYGDIYEDVPGYPLDKWLGRYVASTVALAESKDYPTSPKSALTPIVMRYEGVAELGGDHHNHDNDYKDSFLISGIQDLTISSLDDLATNATIFFLDGDLAIPGGLGFWQGCVGSVTYSDQGHIWATTATTIAKQVVPGLQGIGGATFYIYRPRGGLSMS